MPDSHTAEKSPSGNHWSFKTTEFIISNQDRIYLSQRGIFYLNPSGFCDLRKGTSSCLSSVSSPRKLFHQRLFTQAIYQALRWSVSAGPVASNWQMFIIRHHHHDYCVINYINFHSYLYVKRLSSPKRWEPRSSSSTLVQLKHSLLSFKPANGTQESVQHW